MTGSSKGENIQSYNLFSLVMMITRVFSHLQFQEYISKPFCFSFVSHIFYTTCEWACFPPELELRGAIFTK